MTPIVAFPIRKEDRHRTSTGNCHAVFSLGTPARFPLGPPSRTIDAISDTASPDVAALEGSPALRASADLLADRSLDALVQRDDAGRYRAGRPRRARAAG